MRAARRCASDCIAVTLAHVSHMMVLTTKFGCARLYSRIMCADTDSRRLNLQACYAEYHWIIAYAEKFDVQIFQEELALCQKMVRARVCTACCRCHCLPATLVLTRQQASLVHAQIAAISSRGRVHAAFCG